MLRNVYLKSYFQCDSHGITDEHLLGGHDGEVGDVDKDIDHGHHGDGNTNGQGKVSLWVDDLLSDIVKIIPAIISPQARVESSCNVSNRRGCALKPRSHMLVTTLA